MLTVDEKQIGGAAALREFVDAGASPRQVRAFLDALDAPDDDAVEVDAEGRQAVSGRVLKLATGHEIVCEADGGYTFAQEYPAEVRRAVAAYLADHPIATVSEPIRMEEAIPGDHSSLNTEAHLVEHPAAKAR
jgi:hypothetical protein